MKVAVPLPRSCSCGAPLRVYVEHSCPSCARVSLHDIDDAMAFVQATIARPAMSLTREQRDELAANGMLALARLAREYRPGYGGRDPAGSTFAGYAAKFLPGKLSDAWHRMNGDTLVTQEDQSRKWQVNVKPVSLQAIDEADGNALDQVASLRTEDEFDDEVVDELPKLLTDWWEERCDLVTRFVELRRDGFRNQEILLDMRLVPQQLREVEAMARELTRRLRAAAARAPA